MDVELFTDEDFERLRELVASEGPEWELLNDGETRVWRKPDKKNKSLMVLRAQVTVSEADPDDVMAVWRDIKYRFTWDDRCAQNVCHSTVGDEADRQNEIGYYEGHAPPPLSNRDFVLQSGWRYRYKGEPVWLYMNRSIQHSDYPEVKGIVRGTSHLTGIEMVQADSGDLTITYVTNGDVGGWVPKPVVNWVVTKAAPGLMKQLVDAARGYKEWLAKQAEEASAEDAEPVEIVTKK